MVRDILLENQAQHYAVVHPGRVVLIHRHRLAKEFLRDLLALQELHEPPYIMAEGL